ncbi:unnamed protein product [Protopolystoma xenopodis]|uniref:Uncharacterized protein n=1 Tax=Protopolystoma xenopodis TaxID=117903 RepID=A0A448XKZ9_9PLAT|nr:unnamed protein product [Protopolystoma xenopodis]
MTPRAQPPSPPHHPTCDLGQLTREQALCGIRTARVGQEGSCLFWWNAYSGLRLLRLARQNTRKHYKYSKAHGQGGGHAH